MALLTTAPSSPSSSSHPSSPESEHLQMDTSTTQNASPLSLTSVPAAVAVEADQSQGSSPSTPPSSSAADLARSRSTGRGGCWTCRVRRKKCDEERVDGDSCKTCRRLGIDCLGWGPRRPDWMRDKEKVAEYKASIKAQLTRAGLIRGQPRATYSSLTSSSSALAQSPASSSSSDRYLSGALAGPGPSTLRAGRSDPYPSFPHGRSYEPSRYHHANTVMSAMTGLDAISASPELSMPSPFVAPNNAFNQASLSYSNDISSMSSTSSYPPFLHTPEISPSITPGLRDSPFNEQSEPYIQYYFEHMRKLQFVLPGKELTQTLAFILAGEPQGPLEHAICALASLHSSKANAAQHGYDAATATAESSDRAIDRRFYNKAYVMLMTAKATGRPYAERDAVAAVYLISYHNLAGGGTGWTALLEVAYDWFAQTGIHEEQNPKLALVNMSPAQKLAAKATMWIDTLASVVFTRPPRFLSLYRRLFGNQGGAGYWATTNNDQLDLRMDRLTGCPDEAVLAIAETAALAHWKITESQKGALSVRELARRGEIIEQTLRSQPARVYDDSPTTEGMPMLPTGLAAPADAAAAAAMGPGADEHTRRTVASIWRETAVLYLHTVISDAHPGVPEIVKATNTILDYTQLLGPSHFDRAMIFPLVLAGCMSDDPLIRELAKGRLGWHRDDFYNGSMSQARTFVDYVHNRRQAVRHSHRANVTIDWRECMRERWSAITLV
ncbi:uncharacterized protein PHACADRAFT_193620 [Phanerochaete carnosa HHB-10118-sp]|uniref:Zn(2)-C6 fungal-type domain-containing protein n=1 Tax=Phanerochaete carnosa (strain HHB-10118-sp) TaxID=650164 RepID=K5WHB4_PHACS|nr:uncharacterized protein PHACADRAFT_193620 [Phanerochaete carnosa HHB-10118-sp]EKM58499.1 hypothetical protein PHACADRAFT_193620 [Phanerochaete carnosa HHB-10118-sp]